MRIVARIRQFFRQHPAVKEATGEVAGFVITTAAIRLVTGLLDGDADSGDHR
jgi:hypothetical protein